MYISMGNISFPCDAERRTRPAIDGLALFAGPCSARGVTIRLDVVEDHMSVHYNRKCDVW